MKRLVIDLDGTLTHDDPDRGYPDKEPVLAVVEQLRRYRADGFQIVIHTARNMRTYAGSVGHITAFTVPVILAWLERHAVPYDELVVGKPWCGTDGFYVDDRAVRPSEFVSRSPSEIRALLDGRP